jgi:hypothetical protein
MKTIFKYPLPQLADEQVLEVPRGWNPLCVQRQGGAICIWAEVDTDQPNRKLTIFIRGTGHAMPDEAHEYIGTVQMMDGNLVWHIFHASDYEPENA